MSVERIPRLDVTVFAPILDMKPRLVLLGAAVALFAVGIAAIWPSPPVPAPPAGSRTAEATTQHADGPVAVPLRATAAVALAQGC
jgi:hypothetical protein